ncbi:exodeoxyribonuclease III [Ruminococcaceae bacterium CPB6]|nr:exodeoxyribonuclease III [Ruminococcaceae bacterium CPB6]
MKIISWNVNGLRACIKKGFLDFFSSVDADIFCVQETKMQPGQVELNLPGYQQLWNSAERKGYSGTAVFTRKQPLSTAYDTCTGEGRSITLEFPEYYVVTFYSPNSQQGLARIDYRMQWEDTQREYLMRLDAQKPVILCGDLNVAHEEIDLKNPGPNRGNAGFSDQERAKFTQLLQSGFTDTFRALHLQQTGAYSWCYRFHARDTNAGWRIDYFLTSNRLFPRIAKSEILSDVYGSDHCPILLEVKD